MKIVMVEWKDSYSLSSWVEKGTPCNIDSICSVGILKSETDEQVELVPNLGEEMKLHSIAIPRGCIKRIRGLKVSG